MATMIRKLRCLSRRVALFSLATSIFVMPVAAGDWPQLQGDALRSGDASGVQLADSLGLIAAVPLTDGIYAAPVVAGGHVYAIDGSGVVFALDARLGTEVWRFLTRGGAGNCNNVAAPAVVGE